MKFCKSAIIIFPILFFALFSQANAQACGEYQINITIQSEDGKPVENSVVQLLPIEKDETRGKTFVRDAAKLFRHSINYPEGYSFTSFHKLIISADGFKTAENLVKLTSCQQRDVTVTLARLDSSPNAVWQFVNNISIQVIGSDGKNLSDVKLTVSDKLKNSRKNDLKFGSAYLYLSNGEYNFRFEKSGYQIEEVKVDLTSLSGRSLKVELKPLTSERNNSILSGTVYDAVGAVMSEVKVTAINEKGEKFEAMTNDDGVYSLSLPFNSYDAKTSSANFRITKFEIIVDLEHRGFEKFSVKDFKFVPAYSGKMIFDIALDSRNPEPCGYAGEDCLESPILEIEKGKVQNKILKRPLEELPKKPNKSNKEN